MVDSWIERSINLSEDAIMEQAESLGDFSIAEQFMGDSMTPPAGRTRPTVPPAPPEATEAAGDAQAAQGGPEAAPAAAESPVTPERPPLPTVKTSLSGVLEAKTVLLYGQAGIGKSTMASQWAGGSNLFFDTAGELSDLEVYRVLVPDWLEFRRLCADYAGVMTAESMQYTGAVIDTADLLGTFCAQTVRKNLGIRHESDAEWGKGWTMVREEFISRLAKLQALPGGLVLVSHAKMETIKTRSEEYNRATPTLTGGVRDACINSADLVLFLDYDESGENRIIYTKPDKYHEAKERGQTPRLPAEIPWPAGTNGWDVLKEAWDAGGA